ncbi:glycosyltransferase [Formosa sediminum]|uniref:glycosyltransferase n=1 Tax=Formosa sediminum TaxID=2594004 RepID=UPI00163D60DD|nr:glycosyltransferase [Formosa sediminum]
MLAIVIPYYKITFFKQTLESLANQTDKRFKVYIGNDASLENPENLINEYKNKFPIVYKRFSKNLGGISLVKQWERCFKLVENEKWITILGDDDVYGENVVESFYDNLKEIEQERIKVVRFATHKINSESVVFSEIFKHPKKETCLDFFSREVRSSLSEYFFNKKQLLKIGFKDLPLGWSADKLAVFEVSNFNFIFSINEAIISVRISENSISGGKGYDKQKLEAIYKYNYYIIDTYQSECSPSQYLSFSRDLNKSYLNSKIHFLRYLKINYLYLKKGDFSSVYNFQCEVYNSIKLKY